MRASRLFFAARLLCIGGLEGRWAAVEALVARGDWSGSVEAVGAAASGADAAGLREAVERGAATYRGGLEALIAAGKGAAGRPLVPAFRWAQNDTALFIQVKFVHAISAPADTDASLEAVVVDGSSLRVRASSATKRWELALDALWAPLESTSDAPGGASAGRATFVLAKAAPSRWPRLVKCGVAMPSSYAGAWPDMQEAVGASEASDDPCPDHAAAAAPPPKTAAEDNEAPAPKKRVKKPMKVLSKFEQELTDMDDAKGAKKEEVLRAAAKSKKAITAQLVKQQKAVEATARLSQRRIRDDAEIRISFLDSGVEWLPRWVPRSFVVRDGPWDVFVAISEARLAKENGDPTVAEALRRSAASTAKLAFALCIVLAMALASTKSWRFFALLAALIAAAGQVGAAGVVLRALDYT
ncbi:hypothetical protein M885DRAFT_505316 [Pelagophyceae sp. CCMP2097]|nr:hypothetical protein M885DRAFT_505316 [Pelagophyceae sp. CCMP2097]